MYLAGTTVRMEPLVFPSADNLPYTVSYHHHAYTSGATPKDRSKTRTYSRLRLCVRGGEIQSVRCPRSGSWSRRLSNMNGMRYGIPQKDEKDTLFLRTVCLRAFPASGHCAFLITVTHPAHAAMTSTLFRLAETIDTLYGASDKTMDRLHMRTIFRRRTQHRCRQRTSPWQIHSLPPSPLTPF